MIITNVQIRETKSTTRLEAVVSLTFDDMFVIHDIKVISSDTGYFLAMPSHKVPNGSFKDIAHPISQETRSALERIVIGGFNMLRETDALAVTLTAKPGKTTLLNQQLDDFDIEFRYPIATAISV